MKKAALLFLIALLLTACQAGGDVPLQSSSLPRSEHSSISSQAPSPVQSDSNSTCLYVQEGLAIPISHDPNMSIANFSATIYGVTFEYSVGDLQGQTTLHPGYQQQADRWKDITSISYSFEVSGENAYMQAEWLIGDDYGQDTFVLDGTRNIWVKMWQGTSLYPLLVTKEQAQALFPNEELTAHTFAAFISFEVLQDVSIYLVPDHDLTSEGPQLLEHFPAYGPEDDFLWQTDSSYKNHITVQYTDRQGEQVVFSYYVGGGKNPDGTSLILLEAPDRLE